MSKCFLIFLLMTLSGLAVACALPVSQSNSSGQDGQTVLNAFYEYIVTSEAGGQHADLMKKCAEESVDRMYKSQNIKALVQLKPFHGHQDCIKIYLEAIARGVERFRELKHQEQAQEGIKHMNW